MNYWKVILATIVIFGAGVITGGLLVNHVAHPAHPFSIYSPHPPKQPIYDTMPEQLRPEFLTTNFVKQLDDNLNLSPKQKEQIRKIIAQAQQNTHDLWKLVAPQFQLVFRGTRQQIRDVLTPEQKKEFEFLMRQQRSLRKQPSTNAPVLLPSPRTNGPAI